MPSFASSPQIPINLPVSPMHLTCLFPHSFPLNSCGSFPLEFVPNLHLPPDTAPATKQGDCVKSPCQYHKLTLALLSALQFYTRASKERCSVTLPLTSYCWYPLELGQVTVKSCPGRCPSQEALTTQGSAPFVGQQDCNRRFNRFILLVHDIHPKTVFSPS